MNRLVQKQTKTTSGRTAAREGFMRSEDGSFIIFGLILFVMMLMVGGMAVDFMRFEEKRVRLQSTLDRAVLAAASLEQELDADDVVVDYFEKAGLGSYIDRDDIGVTERPHSRRVEANAKMRVDSIFLNFVGISELYAPAAGAAEEATSLTEISLVVDVSGSMGWNSSSGRTRIEELRRAAKKFVNIVMCDPSRPDATTDCVVEADTVTVSLLPYAEQALVGEAFLSKFNVTGEHDYSSCVTFDAADFSSAAITPDTPLQRTGHFDPWRKYYQTPASWTCATDSWRAFTPISGSLATLHSRINALGASGNTSIDVGAKWGVALLNPALQPITEELVAEGMVDEVFDDRPMPPTRRGLQKLMVLMTDGENTSQHYLYDDFREGPSPVYREIKHDGSLGSKYSVHYLYNGVDWYYWDHDGSWNDHPFGTGTTEECVWRYDWRTGYYEECTEVSEGNGAQQVDYVDLWRWKTWAWYDRFSWLPSQGSYINKSPKDARLLATCSAAKAEGITIYTIGFETSNASAATMRNCASSPAHHFDADGLNLSDAFSAIAREIAKLRLIN